MLSRLIVMLVVLLTAVPAGADVVTDQTMLVAKAANTVERLRRDTGLQRDLENRLSRARAVLIVPDLVKGGFIWGGGMGNRGAADPRFIRPVVGTGLLFGRLGFGRLTGGGAGRRGHFRHHERFWLACDHGKPLQGRRRCRHRRRPCGGGGGSFHHQQYRCRYLRLQQGHGRLWRRQSGRIGHFAPTFVECCLLRRQSDARGYRHQPSPRQSPSRSSA